MQLRKWFTNAAISQRELAKRLDISPMAVSRYLRGERIPAPTIMRRIVDVTNGAVQPNDFYVEAEE